MKRQSLFVALFLFFIMGASAQDVNPDDYLNWTAKQSESVGKSTNKNGNVSGGVRLLSTERSKNYKLRATWFTPEVIRASARWAQLRSRLTDNETKSLVAEAEAVGDTVVMVEIDPNEGSGVIPPDWEAFLQPKGSTNPNNAVRGSEKPELRKIVALQGVMQRNYDYDRLWVVFPLLLEDGKPIVGQEHKEVELVVRIHNREGAVSWVVPDSIRSRIDALKAEIK